jgi:hypothetical protein
VQSPLSCPKANHALQQESDSDADTLGASVFQSHNRPEELPMSRNLIAIRERDHQAHPHGIMGHGRREIEAITREINHLANVLDFGESGVKGPNVER